MTCSKQVARWLTVSMVWLSCLSYRMYKWFHHATPVPLCVQEMLQFCVYGYVLRSRHLMNIGFEVLTECDGKDKRRPLRCNYCCILFASFHADKGEALLTAIVLKFKGAFFY